jgi:hypothetical protein
MLEKRLQDAVSETERTDLMTSNDVTNNIKIMGQFFIAQTIPNFALNS